MTGATSSGDAAPSLRPMRRTDRALIRLILTRAAPLS